MEQGQHHPLKHGPIYDWMRRLAGISYTGGEPACRNVEELFAGPAFKVDSVLKLLAMEEEELDTMLTSPTKSTDHLPVGLREIIKRAWRDQRLRRNKG